MKKVLLKVMTKEGHIQEGIVEMVSGGCNSNWLHCNCDEGVDRNCNVLDAEYEIHTREIEMIKPYIFDTEEVPTQRDETQKGEKFHRSAIIKDGVPTVTTEEKHIYTKEELDSLNEDELEKVAELFGIDTMELFNHEIIEAILELQKELSHES